MGRCSARRACSSHFTRRSHGGQVAARRACGPRTNWVYLSDGRHLDGLAALGERVRVEPEALPALRPGTYLEPFALRALGLVREDASLSGSGERFEAFGLEWHAAHAALL